MRLEKGMIKDVKLGREEVVGLKLNGTYLFETTGPSYWNIYTIQIPAGVAVQVEVQDYDNATWKNENNYVMYVDWGVGEPVTDHSGERRLFKYYNNSSSRDPWTIKIKTTGEFRAGEIDESTSASAPIGTRFLGKYIKDIASIRTDYISGSNLFGYFSGIKTIREPVLERLNTGVFDNMGHMFEYCTSLEKLNLSSFDTSNVVYMANMFAHCTSLTELNLSNFDTSNVTDMSQMFWNCEALHTLRLDNCSKDTIEKIITSPHFPTNKITGKTKTIYCQDFGLEPPINWVFNHNIVIEPEEPEVPVDPPTPDEPEEPEIPLYEKGRFQGKTDLTEVRTMVDSSHINLNYMFENCSNLVSVNTEDWDTSNVTTMRNMFYGCTSLVELDLSNWKTVQVADEDNMCWMFYGCSSLEFLDLSNWNLSFSTDLHYAFHGCDKLHTIKLDNCDLSTIERVISSNGFTTNAIEGITRTIYVDKSLVITDGNIVDGIITYPPTNWVFEYIPE